MRKNNKKSFNWYGMRQHFSIRKYHFGAASVLLGMSLALGAGGQAVKAEETAASSEALASTTATSSTQASSEVVQATSVETAATETVASTTPAATTTEVAATERTATIDYIVQYLLEDGTLVEAVVKSATVTTTDATAKTTVDVTAELPEGYVLAEGQAETTSNQVTEGAENLVTIKVAKKAEVAATTTEAPAATTTATETAAPATTTEAATDATEVSVPVTAEEAKVVLEQVTSEAEVLANEAERLVAASDSDNTALKAAAAATKLSATEATTVLKDSVATLEQVNTQIDAVRTNVEALALELRKFLGTDVIEVALNNSLSDLKVGDGTGILIETGTTATPSMDDANGAGIKNHTLRTGIAATSETGWYTFESYDFLAYNENQPAVYIKGAPIDAYIRYSLDSNANTSTVLAELVSTTSGQVLEAHTLEQGASVTLTYPQTVNSNNETVTITYDATTATEGSTQGMMVLKGTKDGNVIDYNYMIVPDYQINTTRYVVEDGTVLATYSLQTIAGQPVTPSGQREFSGYAYKSTTKEVVQGGLPAGTVYMAGKVNESTVHYKAIRKVISDTQVVTEYYFLDPTYTGTVDWEGTDTTGFIKLIETSPLTYTDGKTYDYNKNPKIYAPYTNDEESGYMVFKESPANAEGSKYRVVAQWSGSKEHPYGRIFIGTQVYTTAKELGDNELKWRGVNDKFDKLGGDTGFAPFGIQQNLRNAAIATAFETTHIYTPVPQEAIIRYQVEGATDYLEDSGTLTGNPGTDIAYSTEDTINKYKKLGYELVSDNFTTDAGQDYDYDEGLQEFLVVIKPRLVDVPKTVVPGDPVDPTDPNSPVWPDTTGNLETTQEVTRTVEYKYDDGTPVLVDAAGNVLPKASTEGTPLVKTETVTFTRPAQVNLVTREVTYGEWVADTTDTLQGNVLPQVPGYTASRTTLEGADAPMTETINAKTVTAIDDDINEVVYFAENPKYGDVVVNYVNEDGKVIATPVVDTNDALVGTDYSTADQVPAKIVEDATGDVYYYKEIKAGSNETGTVVEGITEVTYVYEKAGNVVVNYVTEDGTPIKTPVNDETNAKPGTEYNTTDNKPTEITGEDGSRYVLIPSKTIGSETGTVEGGKTTEITYVYKKVANWIPQIPGVPEGQEPKVPYPFDPTNPDKPIDPTSPYPDGEVPSIPHVPGFTPVDPKTNEPLKPVDPNDPGKGYVPPTPDESGKDTPIPYVQNGNVVVNYVTEDGTPIKTPVNDETNAPAGKSYDTTDNKPTEIIGEDGSRYVLIPSKTIGSETGTVEGGKTTEITYVYKKVANWIPEIPATPENPTPVNPVIPYPFDPTNPDKPIDPTSPYPDGEVPSIPHVPGFTPVDPKTNEPLKPVDPNDPGKGYVPPTPDESGKDTPIPYVQNGNVVVNYVTEDGTPIKTPVNDETNAPAGKSYDTTDNKPTEIIGEDGSRYVLIPSKTIGSETGTVEGGKTTEITYVYKKVANWIPEIPATPENPTPVNPVIPYPFDPTNPDKPIDPTSPYPDGEVPSIPHVPGFTPVDPKDNTPLTPVDPEDPSKGYVPPTPDESGKDTPIPYVQNGNVVVNYVTEDGTPIKTPVNDETNAPAGKSYDTTDNKPTEIIGEDGSRYVLIPSKTIGSETGTVEGGKTTEITYVYKKVANWIPEIPATPENPTPVNPVIPYPFDPTNPDKPIDPTSPYPDGEVPSIPHVPGFTPVDPKDNTPLTPVDPEDPSKGYVPPTPDESGKDTPIPYVQNGNVVVNYVTEDGTPIKTPVNDETNAPAGKSYDTTDNKPTEIIGEDGSRYVLIPSKTIGSETGTVEGGKTTEITYVYKKVANWIPEIPATPENPTPVNPVIPYPFDPTNPDKPIDPTSPYPDGEVPSIPHVPGYVPVGPDGVTPLTPVDPEDPSKGYVPPVPEVPGVDTPIPYVPVTPETPGTPVVPPVTPPATPVVPGEPVTPPVTPVVPGEPVAPATPVTPVTPATPAKPAEPATSAKSGAAQLPNTGESSTAAASALGVGMLVAALALAGKRRRNED